MFQVALNKHDVEPYFGDHGIAEVSRPQCQFNEDRRKKKKVSGHPWKHNYSDAV